MYEGDTVDGIPRRKNDPLKPLIKSHWRKTQPSHLEEPRPRDRDVTLKEQMERTEEKLRILQQAEERAQAARRGRDSTNMMMEEDEEEEDLMVQEEDTRPEIIDHNDDVGGDELDPKLAGNNPYFNRTRHMREQGDLE